jgi:carboxymethylenebutenolidase
MKSIRCMAGVLGLFLATAAVMKAAKTETVSYKAGSQTLNAFLAAPDKPGPHPGIVMIHEIWGLNDWIKGQAKRFADQGYVVLAVDLFHGQTFEEPSRDGRKVLQTLVQEQILQTLKAAYGYLETRPETNKAKIGTLGWCMGGRLALQLAMSEPTAKAVVINYGQLPISATEAMDSKNRDWTKATPEGIASVHFPVLGNFGGDDADIKPPEVLNFQKVLRAAGKNVDVKLYPGFGHGFENDSSKDYSPAAAKDAYARIDSFLAKNLK